MNTPLLSKSISRSFTFILLAMFCAGFTSIQTGNDWDKNVLVVCMKVSPDCSTEEACEPKFPKELRDTIHSPRFLASTYEAVLNGVMASFIREASYNQAIVNFEVVRNPNSSNGWFQAPHSLEDYNDPEGDEIPREYMGPDGLNLAYSVIGDAVYNYDMVLVINNIQSLYGYTTGLPQFDSNVVVSENADTESFYEVLAHEFGHVYGMMHVEMGPYDIVGDSDVLSHYGGWSKVYAGWVTGITDMDCVEAPCVTNTVLDPLERQGNNVLRIPFHNMSQVVFNGYYVECRAKIGFDKNIPEAGVVISYGHSIPTVLKPTVLANIIFPKSGDDYSNPALAPGEAYVDEERGITIKYIEKDSYNRCTVEATRGEIDAPDPRIVSGAEVLPGDGFSIYYSSDIWIDSQENGWDVYPPGTQYFYTDATTKFPIGFGDPIWANHENRIKFLVRNPGYSAAENVFVDVYVTQPIMLYIPGFTCDGPEPNFSELIATVQIDHLDKDEIYVGEIPWTPTVNASAEVRVVIRDYVGELSHDNNTASETYIRQNIPLEAVGDINRSIARIENEALAESGSWPQAIQVTANPNCLEDFQYRFTRRTINAIAKKDWVMDLDSLPGELTPGGELQVPLSSIPPEVTQAGDCEVVELEMEAFMDDFFVPVDGLVYKSCVVTATELSCNTPQDAIEPDTVIDVSGNLTPAEGGEILAIEYTNQKGERTLQYVETGKDGSYLDQFMPDVTDTWTMQAFWQGTDASAPAESPVCEFNVTSGEPEFTLEHNINCRSGPGTDYPVITSGLIGDVVDVEGRSGDFLWLYGIMHGNKCWMLFELGKLNVNPWTLPEKEAPPPPIRSTETPSVCSMYTSELGCNRRKDICKWVTEVTGAGACVPR